MLKNNKNEKKFETKKKIRKKSLIAKIDVNC